MDEFDRISALFDEVGERLGEPGLSFGGDDTLTLTITGDVCINVRYSSIGPTLLIWATFMPLPEKDAKEILTHIMSANWYGEKANGFTIALVPKAMDIVADRRVILQDRRETCEFDTVDRLETYLRKFADSIIIGRNSLEEQLSQANGDTAIEFICG